MFIGHEEDLKADRRTRGTTFVVVGAGCLVMASLIFFKSNDFTVRFSEHPVIFQRADYPIAFIIGAIAVFIIGAYHLVQGIRLLGRRES